MHHYNIRENAVREAINKHKEISIHHVRGKTNPTDLLTKEHKSPDIFQSLWDSFMSCRLSGGCLHIHNSTVDTRKSHEYVTVDHKCRHAVAASSLLPMTLGSMAP